MAQSQKHAGVVTLLCRLPQPDADSSRLPKLIHAALQQSYPERWLTSRAADFRRLHAARNSLVQAMNAPADADARLTTVWKAHAHYWLLLKRFVARLDKKEAPTILYSFLWKSSEKEQPLQLRDIRMELLAVTYNTAALYTQLASRIVRKAVNSGATELTASQLQRVGAYYGRAQQLLKDSVVPSWQELQAHPGFSKAASLLQKELTLAQVQAAASLCYALSCFWACLTQPVTQHQSCTRSLLHAGYQLADVLDKDCSQLVGSLLPSAQLQVLKALEAHAQLRSDIHAHNYLLELYGGCSDSVMLAGYSRRIRDVHQKMHSSAQPLAVHIPFFLTNGFFMDQLQQHLDAKQVGAAEAPEAPHHPDLNRLPFFPKFNEGLLKKEQQMEEQSRAIKDFLWMAPECNRMHQLQLYSTWYTQKLRGADELCRSSLHAIDSCLRKCCFPWLLVEAGLLQQQSIAAAAEADSPQSLLQQQVPSLLEKISTCIANIDPQLKALKKALVELGRSSSVVAGICGQLQKSGNEADRVTNNCRITHQQLAAELKQQAPAAAAATKKHKTGELEAYLSALQFMYRSYCALKKTADSMDLTDDPQGNPRSSDWLVSQSACCKRHSASVEEACKKLKEAFDALRKEDCPYVLRAQLHSRARLLKEQTEAAYNYHLRWSEFVCSLTPHNPHYPALSGA